MRNRVSSLFDLETFLRPPAASPTAAPASPGTAKRRPPTAGGGKARGASARRGRAGRTVALAFDHGQPVEVIHGGRGAALSHAAARPPFPDLHAGLRYQVEPFEAEEEEREADALIERSAVESGESEEERVTGSDEEDTEDAAEDEASAETDDTQRYVSGQSARGARVSTPRYAQELAAVERDLKDLAVKARHPTPDEERAVQADTDDEREEAPSTPTPPANPPTGHGVFDAMAKGIAYATEFRLQPVRMMKVFEDLDARLNAEQRSQASRAAARERVRQASAQLAAVVSPTPPIVISDAELARDIAALTPPLAEAKASPGGQLQHFRPAELVLSAAEASTVITWFWPDVQPIQLGAITDIDRSFAQALLVEAVDASADMGIVEAIFRESYMKVPTNFGDVKEMVKNLAKEAIEKGWFTRSRGKITREQIDTLAIYESVRGTLARNFRSVIKLRVATGDYTGY